MKISSILPFKHNIFVKNQKSVSQNPFLAPLVADSFEFRSKSSSFGAACAESNFKIKEIRDLRCPVCDRIMLNTEEREKFACLVSSKTGKDLVEAFDTYGEEEFFISRAREDDPVTEPEIRKEGAPHTIYREVQQEIVNTLKELALENPTKPLNELVQIKSKMCLGELIVQQMDVVRELEKYLEGVDLPQDERESINYIIQLYKNQILGKNEVRFKRLNFIHDLNNVVENTEIQDKITEIITKLPNSANSVDSFFVKWGIGNYTSREIALNLIYDVRPTAEHILPKSVPGSKNDTTNYICDCAYCNSKRGDTPFDVWAPTVPDFQEKLQNYVTRVAGYVDDGRLDSVYDSYVETIIKVLHKRSNGFIDLEVPVLETSARQKQLERKKQRALQEAKEINLELQMHISELVTRAQELESYVFCDEIYMIRSMKDKAEKISSKIKDLNDELQVTENDLAAVAKIKRRINQLVARLMKNAEGQAQQGTESEDKELKGLRHDLETKDEQALLLKKERLICEIEQQEDKLQELEASIEEASGFSREALITKYMLELGPIIEKSKELVNKLSELKAQTLKKSHIQKQIEKILAENEKLEKENEEISAKKDMTLVSRDKYDKYLHLAELTDEINGVGEQKRNRKNKNLMEIMGIAQASIDAQMRELSEDDDVKYFMNLDTILKNKKSIEHLSKDLAKIEATEEKIAALEAELARVNGEKTYEENLYEYDALVHETEIIREVKVLPELKAQIASLTTTFKYNEATINQLENNPKIPFSKFLQAVKRIRTSSILKNS